MRNQMFLSAAALLLTAQASWSNPDMKQIYENCVVMGTEKQMEGWEESDRPSVEQGVKQACRMLMRECDKEPAGEMCKAFQQQYGSRVTGNKSLSPKTQKKQNTITISEQDLLGEWSELGRALAPTDDFDSLMHKNYGKRIFHADGKFEFIRTEENRPSETQTGAWKLENNFLSITWPKSGVQRNRILRNDGNVLGLQDIETDFTVYLSKIKTN